MRKPVILLAVLALTLPLLFLGCSGNDGATGPQGLAGPAGPVTNTNESCMICHTTGRIADITNASGGSHYNRGGTYDQPSMTIDTIAVGNVGGTPTVTFHVTSGGKPVTALDNASVRFMIADLVPAGTATPQGTFSTAQFARWAYDRARSGYLFGTFDNTTGAATGNYAYTFATAYGSPSPADNVAPVSYNPAHTQRLAILLSKTGYNSAAAFVDFAVPADGATTPGIGYLERQFVTVDACRKCHGPLLAGTAHGSGYVDTNTCVLCHTPVGSAAQGTPPEPLGQLMTDDGIWLASLVHKLHSKIPIDAFSTRIGGRGYGAVTFPQDVRNCITCHTNSGLALGAGDLTDNWRAHPTKNACKTCHVDYPTGHPAQDPPDTFCGACHPATGHVLPTTGASVTEAHDTSPTAALHPNPMNVPEFDATLSLTPPAGSYYVAGDNVLVTVTLKKHSDNTAVAGSVYTAPKGAVGVSGGGLSTASLYVYGPRALPKPILADPATGLLRQANPMFVTTADTNVKSDTTGFKYQVKIPSGLTAGTYMVRVRIGDYGRVSDNNYVVESIAFQTIQIGNATVTTKVAGDACVNCHGNGSAPFHDARHVVAWDTDECASCHDYSGGHASTLSNRVHAVHAANSWGDMNNESYTAPDYDWSGVTYPLTTWSSTTGLISSQGAGRCDICHTSGNTSYRSVVHEVSCLGCHGDDPVNGGATNHMLQNGGDWPKFLGTLPPAP